MIVPGTLVVLDGLDSAGTSTQVDAVASDPALSANTVVKIGAPVDGDLATEIAYAQGVEAFNPCVASILYEIDRVALTDTSIAQALMAGSVVICDRYTLTRLAEHCTGCDSSCFSGTSPVGRDAITIYLAVPPGPGENEIVDNFEAYVSGHPSAYTVDGTQPSNDVTADIVALLPVVA